MNVAIIPARGGSKRIPRKNIRPFHGKPIIAYSIEAAKASGLFDRIVVSTDDTEIADVAIAHGAGLLPRPPELADDETGTQEVTRHALEWLTEQWRHAGKVPGPFACCIYATAPLLTADDLKRGYAYFVTSGMSYALVDGWFYWGHAGAFGTVPIDIGTAVRCDVGERWIDINTEDDFLKAERMYAELHGHG